MPNDDILLERFGGNIEAVRWHKRYVIQKTIASGQKDHITHLEAEIKSKAETITMLKR